MSTHFEICIPSSENLSRSATRTLTALASAGIFKFLFNITSVVPCMFSWHFPRNRDNDFSCEPASDGMRKRWDKPTTDVWTEPRNILRADFVCKILFACRNNK
jgi:hypothetical protein